MDAMPALEEDSTTYSKWLYNAIKEQITKILTSIVGPSTDVNDYEQFNRLRNRLITEMMVKSFVTAGIAYYVFFILYPQSVRDLQIARDNIEREEAPGRRMEVPERMSYVIMGLIAIELLIISLPMFL